MQVSHVLRAIGLNEDYAVGTIRVSFGKENTIEEIHYIANELKKIVNG
jgi:cysteine desulfurase